MVVHQGGTFGFVNNFLAKYSQYIQHVNVAWMRIPASPPVAHSNPLILFANINGFFAFIGLFLLVLHIGVTQRSKNEASILPKS